MKELQSYIEAKEGMIKFAKIYYIEIIYIHPDREESEMDTSIFYSKREKAEDTVKYIESNPPIGLEVKCVIHETVIEIDN